MTANHIIVIALAAAFLLASLLRPEGKIDNGELMFPHADRDDEVQR